MNKNDHVQQNILSCPIVTECSQVDFTRELGFIQDLEQLKRARALVRAVSVYAFMYQVRKGFFVKGYVVIPNLSEKVPCIIHLRGGSDDFGKIDAPQMLWQIIAYAADGYVVISTQYPGVEGGDGKDMFGGLDDIASIKKLREILKYVPNVDMTRIGVKGHSRGGLMAYMLMREVSWVRTAVIAGAPTDQVRAGKERKDWRVRQTKMFGKSHSELFRRSPLFWVNELPKRTSLLLMHGSADWRVSADHSIRMSQALFDAKVPHRFVLFEGADHGITEYRREYHEMTRAWFKRYLSDNQTLPNIKPHGN